MVAVVGVGEMIADDGIVRRDGSVRPGYEIVFAGREVDEEDGGMGESVEGFEGWAAPEAHALLVESGEEGPSGGPGYVSVCPFSLVRLFTG